MKNINTVILKTSKQTAQEVIAELKRQDLMKNNKITPFQRTEQILDKYNQFKAAIKDKEEQIKDIKKNGIARKSKSITSFASGNYEIKSESEIAEEKIESLTNSIRITKKYIGVIDSALEVIKNDYYFDIIRLKYFEKKSRREIAEYFAVDETTISRNKNKLIDILQIRFFTDEVILQLLS